MKVLHIFVALFFAAALHASAQGPAKRSMPKKVKTEATDAKDKVTDAASALPATPKTEQATEGAEASEQRAATPPIPPKATPAAPIGKDKPATPQTRGAAAGSRPVGQNGRPTGANGRPGAAQGTTPPPGGSYREFPTAAAMPDDAAWRREVYRTLDLTREENAVLYFPITPTAERQNLFCYLFREILRGNITAYEYTLDANEHFDDDHVVKGKKIMDTHNIYYEEVTGDNGKKSIRVNDADLPSEDVKLYFIKECIYYDQHSASFRTKITAICPVIVGGMSDFGEDESTRVPLFWVKYEDAAPYLAKLSLMGSSMNNAAMISADDYFTLGRYKGDIYKTTNLQDKILIQSDASEEELLAERQRIEGELDGFQRHVWGHESKHLLNTYGNPVLDDEGKGIHYNDEGKLVDGQGRRIAFLAYDKDSVNVVSSNPEVDPLPEIVLLNERGFAVDEKGNPLLKEDGTPIDVTDEYPDPALLAGDKKKPSRTASSAPTRRTTASSAPTRRTTGTSSKTSSSKSTSTKSSSSKSTSKPAKTKAPKAAAPKAAKSGGMTVRRERH